MQDGSFLQFPHQTFPVAVGFQGIIPDIFCCPWDVHLQWLHLGSQSSQFLNHLPQSQHFTAVIKQGQNYTFILWYLLSFSLIGFTSLGNRLLLTRCITTLTLQCCQIISLSLHWILSYGLFHVATCLLLSPHSTSVSPLRHFQVSPFTLPSPANCIFVFCCSFPVLTASQHLLTFHPTHTSYLSSLLPPSTLVCHPVYLHPYPLSNHSSFCSYTLAAFPDPPFHFFCSQELLPNTSLLPPSFLFPFLL